MISALFSITAFLSAFLLFVIQPMVGRLLLPNFGGAAAVWNTCLVFFQGMLFLAYVYAHFIARSSPRGTQSRFWAFIHASLIAAAVIVLVQQGFNLDPSGVDLTAPATSVFTLLLVGFAVPLLALGASAPLLQHWYAGQSGKNPYWLYVASNIGSFLALAAYPLIIERQLDLTRQGEFYNQLFLVFALLLIGCLIMSRRRTAHATTLSPTAVSAGSPASGSITRLGSGLVAGLVSGPITGRTFWLWSFLAFLPSGLLVAVTTHLTNDVAPVPLLWVIPLALYLLSFILAFSGKLSLPPDSNEQTPWIEGTRFMALCALFMILPLIYHPLPDNRWLGLSLHLLAFFLIATNLHLHLYEWRPAAEGLTKFYLTVSFGGMLGGLIAGLLPPLLFNSALEYPLLLALYVFSLAPLTMPELKSDSAGATELRRKLSRDALFGVVFVIIAAGVYSLGQLSPKFSTQLSAFVYAISCLLALLCLRRRIVGVAIGALYLLALSHISTFYDGGDTLVEKRNFFGVKRVLWDSAANRTLLIHGRIVHGLQNRRSEIEHVPLAYYADNGPLGQVIHSFATKPMNIGVVGLGVGSIGAYQAQTRRITFFEIDPDVEAIARDTRHFTFMQHCGAKCQVILGDGRLELNKIPNGEFDLLVLDAFSSDSVPVHLLSTEAVRLYLSKLNDQGVLMFNASNKFLHIDAVIAAVAEALRVPAYVKSEREISAGEKQRGRFRSTWVVIPKDASQLPPEGYTKLDKEIPIAPWTDRYSNLFAVIRW